MQPISRRNCLKVTGLVSVSGTVTGCLGDGDGENDGDPGPGPRPNFFTDEHAELGEIIVDEDGFVVYMFDSDERGADESTCYDDCSEAWPPVLLDEEPIGDRAVAAEMTLIEREDGSMQVAANGWPLYYFSGDDDAGQANGQGADDEWWVLRPGGTPYRGDDDDQGNGSDY